MPESVALLKDAGKGDVQVVIGDRWCSEGPGDGRVAATGSNDVEIAQDRLALDRHVEFPLPRRWCKSDR